MRRDELKSKAAFFPMLVFIVAPVAFILARKLGRYTRNGIAALAFMWGSLFWVCFTLTGHIGFAWFFPGGVVALLVAAIDRLNSMNEDALGVRVAMIRLALNVLGVWVGFIGVSLSALILLPDQVWTWLFVVVLMLCQIPICTRASIVPSWYAENGGRESLQSSRRQ